MVLDFPYTVDDEPTESWKVEQVMHWWLLRANAESEAEYDKIVNGLTKQLEEGKQALWEAHQEVSEILNIDLDAPTTNGNNIINQQQKQQSDPNANNENFVPPSHSMMHKQQSSSEVSAVIKEAVTDAVPVPGQDSAQGSSAVTTDMSPSSIKPNTIHIDILSGDYQGTSYDLQPRTKIYCFVGRSQSKKFRVKGISLPKDLEVSTTHGRFEYNRGNFYYTDTGSTNGSRINGDDIEPNVPYHLTTGLLITAGQTTMKVTLTTSALQELD